jgi:hypothetical protein
MRRKNPADYMIGMIGPDVTIEDADLDEMEVSYQGERLRRRPCRRAWRAGRARSSRSRQQNSISSRKSSTAETKRSPVVRFRISEATHEKLETIAKARGISISALTRQVLDEFVSNQTV